MSKSMPSMDLSKSLSPVVPMKSKTPPDELEKSPTIRAKPAMVRIQTSASSISKDAPVSNRHTVHVPVSHLPAKPAAPSPPRTIPTVSI